MMVIDEVVESFTFALIHPTDLTANLLKVLGLLPDHDKNTYLISLLRILGTKKLDTLYAPADPQWWKHDSALVSGAAALLHLITFHNITYREFLLEWLTSSSGGGVGMSIAVRRAVVAVIAKHKPPFQQLFEKCLNQFADKLWIKHTPVLRQEGASSSIEIIEYPQRMG